MRALATLIATVVVSVASGQARAQNEARDPLPVSSDAAATDREPDRGLDTADAIKKRIEQTRLDDDPEERGRHLFALAELRRQQGRLDEARALLVDASVHQREASAHAARARTSLSLSLVLKQLGRVRSAEDAARDALVLDSDLAILNGALNQMEQIALVYQGRGEWDEAERVEQDIRLVREQTLPDLQRIADTLALAQSSLDDGAFDRVNELCHDVLALADPHDAWRQSAVAFEMLGHALKEQDKGILAIERYRNAVEFARRCGTCELLRRLERHVTDVSETETLILKDKKTRPGQNKGNAPPIRFEPLPR